jgi:hypothetical protein
MIYGVQIGPVTIRGTEEADLPILAENLRKADVIEVWASHGLTAKDALLRGYKESLLCCTALYHDVPVAMYGLAAANNPDEAVVWMLGTDALEKHRRHFMRITKATLQFFQKSYRVLWNYVDSRNEKSIRWLKHCGAAFREAEPFGPFGTSFMYFEFRRP